MSENKIYTVVDSSQDFFAWPRSFTRVLTTPCFVGHVCLSQAHARLSIAEDIHSTIKNVNYEKQIRNINYA